MSGWVKKSRLKPVYYIIHECKIPVPGILRRLLLLVGLWAVFFLLVLPSNLHCAGQNPSALLQCWGETAGVDLCGLSPIFVGNIGHSLLSVVSATSLLSCPYQIKSFCHERILSHVFSASIEMVIMIFVLDSIDICYISWLSEVKPTLHSWDKSYLVMDVWFLLHVAGFIC